MTTAARPAVRQQQPIETGEWETAATPAVPAAAKPAGPRDWTIGQIIEALSKPLPQSILKQRKQGGATLDYVPWHTVNRILDKYSPGFLWEIRSITTTSDDIFMVGRLTIPASDGDFYREATGTEKLSCGSYGDASSNSEGMAFRRAAAKFGLALGLYDKK